MSLGFKRLTTELQTFKHCENFASISLPRNIYNAHSNKFHVFTYHNISLYFGIHGSAVADRRMKIAHVLYLLLHEWVCPTAYQQHSNANCVYATWVP